MLKRALIRTAVIYQVIPAIPGEVAEYIARQTGADHMQVYSRFPYNHLSRMIVGVRLALSGTEDPVDTASIDVFGYNGIVIGFPSDQDIPPLSSMGRSTT
jgi:hypothetical protein